MINFHWTQGAIALGFLLLGLLVGILWSSRTTIVVEWPQGIAFIILFLTGLLAGVFWDLPYDQATNLVGLVAGLVVSIFSVGITIWSIMRSQEPRLAEIQRGLSNANEQLATTQALVVRMLDPMVSTMLEQFGTAANPSTRSSVTQEPGEPAPVQASQTGPEAQPHDVGGTP